MLYSAWITKMRQETGDLRRRVHVDWTADGSTVIYQMPADTFPVLDQVGTYVVKVNGSQMTETTDYTLDKETGTLVLTATPSANQAVLIDSSAVYLTDSAWLTVGNDVIRSLGDDFWKEFVDTTSLTATASMLSLSLVSGIPLCIAVYDFMARLASTDEWEPVENRGNWRYDRENNVLYVSNQDVFPTTGEKIKVRGLKTFTLGTAVSDTIDLQDRFMTILDFGALARYWQYRYKSVVELVSKMTQESTRTPLQELMMLSDRFKRDYEAEKAKLKPQKPARLIPSFMEGAGRP